ncbi:hypothetical protein F5Y00DRAFT_206638 [Daldinia vernicosa]|uniref:uncharacterized protein n=1 Tax=Daldinia vernicosa TaxID=114800 RepID=UPI0020077095|nr:uncharacterized protein F5Y00DRAFT_206638 [Daldinia vernicosa]KAI0852092.1 hypothetical protein F5Y00DRAFT_206638 [Daldinia vernicosa]
MKEVLDRRQLSSTFFSLFFFFSSVQQYGSHTYSSELDWPTLLQMLICNELWRPQVRWSILRGVEGGERSWIRKFGVR